MATYTGTWTFMNVMHSKHRESGTAKVQADNEMDAKMRIRHEGAKELFDGSMSIYFEASNVREVT